VNGNSKTSTAKANGHPTTSAATNGHTAAEDTTKEFKCASYDSTVLVLDLRVDADSSVHGPLAGAQPVLKLAVESPKDPNPFRDADTLVHDWTTFDTRLVPHDSEFGPALFARGGKKVLVVSYDGNVASVACSVLRSRGVEAFWLDGRVEELRED
jgi:hypothetical protein